MSTTEYKSKFTGQEIDRRLEQVEENEVLIKDLQNTKIDKENDDYYPNMSVGLADNLAGEDVVASEFSFRRSGGGAIADGTARIEVIKGNSVVWNQLINNVADTTGDNGWWVRPGSSLSIEGREIVVTTHTSESFNQISQKIDFIEGHNYLITFGMSASINTESNLQIALSSTLYGAEQERVDYVLEENMAFIKIHAAKKSFPYLILYQNSLVAEGTQMRYTDFKVIDLTLMFGVGNEPTTITEAYARMPIGVDSNAYEKGKVIDLTADSLVSRGFNQWDEEWELGSLNGDTGLPNVGEVTIRSKNFIPVISGEQYFYNCPSNATGWVTCYDANLNPVEKHISTNIHKKYLSSIYKNAFTIPQGVRYIKFYVVSTYGTIYNYDICINLSDSSKNGTYEPYIKRTQSLSIIGEGLKSAGTAQDEIHYNKTTQKWEMVQRIGTVDMGSLPWIMLSDGDTRRFSVDTKYLPTMKVPNNNSNNNIILCSTYPCSPFNNIQSKDKVIMPSIYSNEIISIKDLSYTDATSFKTAMQGVILYYELAEPIVTILDDTDNLDYKVWNGGTEKIVSDIPTTPLKADIAYGFNAIGKIKELESLVTALRAKIGV